MREKRAVHVEGNRCGCYNRGRSARFRAGAVSFDRNPATISVKRTALAARGQRVSKRGQVAQVVERSPEKAGVGGSTPSLATIFSIT